jgi:DNA-binding NarL/FixJ family response regulator
MDPSCSPPDAGNRPTLVLAGPPGPARVAAEEVVLARFDVLGVVDSAIDAAPLVADLVPDLVVVTTDLPGVHELLADLVVRVPAAARLVVGGGRGEGLAAAVIHGAGSVWTVGDGPEVLVERLHGLLVGRSTITQGAAARLLTAYEAARLSAGDPHLPPLSPTEHEVLARLAEGATPLDIASFHDVPVAMVLQQTALVLGRLHDHAATTLLGTTPTPARLVDV